MLTLNDLKPRIVEISIIMGKLPPEKEGGPLRDDVKNVPLRVPSWIEWNELGLEIPEPEREKVADFTTGKKVYKDEGVAAYEQKRMIANNQRMVRRLAFALIEAGNFPELKGKPADEQMDAIGAMDAGILQALVKEMNKLVQFTSARIAEKAERFRPTGERIPENGHASVFTEELDFEEVEEALSG